MEFIQRTSPHLPPQNSVTKVMLKVLAALIPGVVLTAVYFGPGVLINILLAIVVAVASEALMLTLRKRPLMKFLSDCSVLVTAVLLALALPPLAPWWLTTLAVSFAVIFGKHIYGGLGYNPFNPAMIGYVVVLVSFPREMTFWLPPEGFAGLDFGSTLQTIFLGADSIDIDAVTAATPLDQVKTRTGLGESVAAIRGGPLWGVLAGKGWEWINLAFLAGGLWMMQQRVIAWQIPTGVLAGLGVCALLGWLGNPDGNAPLTLHWLGGGIMLGAFFIATDPVSAATTPRGRLFYGLGIGVLIYVIRNWGGYPDGIAFAVLLMNTAAPIIDTYCKPRVYGHS